LASLDASAVADELRASKMLIERELGRSCRHFACPWGQPNTDFRPDRDPMIAQQLGYGSFFTTLRGKARQGQSTFLLPRDKIEPGWGNYQMRFFFSQ